jgi:prophage regulatory protein
MSDRLLRVRDVLSRIGMSRTTLYDSIRAGTFPRPARIHGIAAWSAMEVDAWIDAQLASRETGNEPRRRGSPKPQPNDN